MLLHWALYDPASIAVNGSYWTWRADTIPASMLDSFYYETVSKNMPSDPNRLLPTDLWGGMTRIGAEASVYYRFLDGDRDRQGRPGRFVILTAWLLTRDSHFLDCLSLFHDGYFKQFAGNATHVIPVPAPQHLVVDWPPAQSIQSQDSDEEIREETTLQGSAALSQTCQLFRRARRSMPLSVKLNFAYGMEQAVVTPLGAPAKPVKNQTSPVKQTTPAMTPVVPVTVGASIRPTASRSIPFPPDNGMERTRCGMTELVLAAAISGAICFALGFFAAKTWYSPESPPQRIPQFSAGTGSRISERPAFQPSRSQSTTYESPPNFSVPPTDTGSAATEVSEFDNTFPLDGINEEEITQPAEEPRVDEAREQRESQKLFYQK